ncbi:hypothetical protein MNV49_003481 [Pseudohyphozyma bogoriensis]|nr:hypothetical protein MNV49_003481 [Pseudohyphozyma bogoriensis]
MELLAPTQPHHALSLIPTNSTGGDPFRDPSIDLARSHSPLAPPSFTSPSPAPSSHNSYSDSYASDEGSRDRGGGAGARRPPIPSRPSEISRQLEAAMSVDSFDLSNSTKATPESGPRPAHRAPPKGEGPKGFFGQFRSGSGWFAPVVPPTKPLTKAERDAIEAERIKKLRESTSEGKGAKRPGLMKRVSSGVEMLSFGGRKRGESNASRIAED